MERLRQYLYPFKQFLFVGFILLWVLALRQGWSALIGSLIIAALMALIEWVFVIHVPSRRNQPTYKELPLSTLDEACVWAKATMAREGITYPSGYADDWADCEWFAEALSFYMNLYFVTFFPPHTGFGRPIKPVPYQPDARAKGHVCVEALSTEGTVFYDVYPGKRNRFVMSLAERQSIPWSNFK